MPTQAEILTGLRYPLGRLNLPINASDDAPYTFTYQFANSGQPSDLDQDLFSGWTPVSAAEQIAVRLAFDHIETFLNVRFVEVMDDPDPDLNVGKVDIEGGFIGYGGFDYRFNGSGDLREFDGYVVFEKSVSIASDYQSLILHELGHALTLKHPFEEISVGAITHGVLDPEFDNEKYTLMSYTDNPELFVQEDTFMLFDMFALQDIWGANTSTAVEDNVYTGPRSTGVDVIWDAGGTDVLDASSRSGPVNLDLRHGTFSSFDGEDSVAIAYNVVIENAIGGSGSDTLTGNASANQLQGGSGDDWLFGNSGDDILQAGDGRDFVDGGDGADTINGGSGDDDITGGSSVADRRDTIYGGDGNDRVDAGYGNDLVYGQNGDDTIAGGFGADELFGQSGNDTITGSAFSDLVFGGAGNDFVNGGFGFDRINGGTGADQFFHAGIEGHGSDWIQDYASEEGDRLVFGGTGATVDDFQVNFTHTASREGERSGDDDVQEAFVIYRPTGQILWALVDGGDQSAIDLRIGADTFDLL